MRLMPLILVLVSVQIAHPVRTIEDSDPSPAPLPLEARVGGTGTALNAALQERIAAVAAADVQLPRNWPDPAAEPKAGDSRVVRGAGYATFVRFGRYPDDPARLHGVVYTVIPAADVVYWLGPPRWVSVRDGGGRELTTPEERAAAGAKEWWATLGVGGTGVRDDGHDGLLNFEFRLPRPVSEGFSVLRGYTAVLVATAWDTVTVDKPGPGAADVAFEKAGVKATWPEGPPPDKRAAYVYRLEPTAGFEPNLWTHFDDPFVVAHAVDGEGNRRRLDGGVWSRQSRDDPTRRGTKVRSQSWLYTVNAPLKPGESLELKMLAKVAVVQLPFEFRDVVLPPMPPAKPDLGTGTSRPARSPSSRPAGQGKQGEGEQGGG